MAVSAKAGEATLYLSPDNSGGHQLHVGPRSTRGQVEVDVTTLPDILAHVEGPVAALKVDTVGAGSGHSYSQCQPTRGAGATAHN